MLVLTTQEEAQIDLIKKYNKNAPRYTSYPPATEFHDYGHAQWLQSIARSNARKTPVSLYFHLPFCQSACYFCGCNVIVTNNKNLATTYLEYLDREIHQTSQLIDRSRPVTQLHWGGGTPNYLNLAQVENLWEQINKYYHFADDAEISIEINPRYIDRNYILLLKSLGFNRISFGIQDFNPQVQEAINRVQPEALLFQVMEWIREAGFTSVNVDLIYGLPYQTLATFQETIEKTIKLDPDRIAVFNFAYVPGVKAVQKRIDPNHLPSPAEKLEISQMSIHKLTESGYVFIGMDHFAKPNDELAIAQKEYKLKRNFQGYTTQPDTELFGFGLTSISMLHDAYGQNHKGLKDYYQAVDSGILPITKGIDLTQDDVIRRDVIMQIMSNFRLDFASIEQKYEIDFASYFASELISILPLENDGLIELTKGCLEVTPLGRLLVRNIAVIFDTHILKAGNRILSKAI